MTEEAAIEEGSANVYADLGRLYADKKLLKVQLASGVGEAIKRRKLTQSAAAELIGRRSRSCRACCAASCEA